MLDRLHGYKFAERGVVGVKGKGDMHTYWLTGEDSEFRRKRSEDRDKRRAEQSGKHSKKNLRNYHWSLDSNGCPGIPRSSLKNRNQIRPNAKSNLSRCASLESPKKLRFASNSTLEFNSHYYKCSKKISKNPLLEVITDNSPHKRKPTDLPENLQKFCVDHVSISCPCIQNITILSELQPKETSQRSDLASNSEPLLCQNPVSPSVDSINNDSPAGHIKFVNTDKSSDEVITPLLTDNKADKI